MVFIRYQHVERIDAEEVTGLLDGVCHVFPKMDGSNMCAYSENGEMHTMSRNKEIQRPEPFAEFAHSHGGIERFVKDFPMLRLYGEWMVPHTVRNYIPEVWNRWFVFDVMAEDPETVYRVTAPGGTVIELDCMGQRYLPFETYAPILEMYGIEFVEPLCLIDHPTEPELRGMADEENRWMMATGCGEGIVVKRYDYSNAFGRNVWGKVINSQYSSFKAEFRKMKMNAERNRESLEHFIAIHYATPDVVNKEYCKILDEGEGVNPARLLNTVFRCVVTENIWDVVKKRNLPRIDFRVLRKECDLCVKMVRPELFGLSALSVAELTETDDVH